MHKRDGGIQTADRLSRFQLQGAVDDKGGQHQNRACAAKKSTSRRFCGFRSAFRRSRLPTDLTADPTPPSMPITNIFRSLAGCSNRSASSHTMKRQTINKKTPVAKRGFSFSARRFAKNGGCMTRVFLKSVGKWKSKILFNGLSELFQKQLLEIRSVVLFVKQNDALFVFDFVNAAVRKRTVIIRQQQRVSQNP